MILNVFKEGVDKSKDNLSNYNDSVEIKRIKEYLADYSLDYISDNLRNILDFKGENNLSCFEKKENKYRFIDNNEKFRVILYIRLSEEDGDLVGNDVSRSIRNQLLYLLTECKDRGWNVVAIFCEEGISGANDKRPEWLKSLRYCECGNTEIYLCKAQSRFSRSMEMIEKYLHNNFVSWNIRFIGLVDNSDTFDKGNKKTRQLNGLVDEWRVEEQSISTRKILKNKKMNGLYTGSFAPYGYVKDPNDKYRLIIDEQAAKVVRLIFDLYANGEGYFLISKYLNEKNIPTPAEYKKMQGSNFYSANSTLNKRIEYRLEKNDTIESIANRFKARIESIIEYNNLEDTSLLEGQEIVIPLKPAWNYDTIRKILKDETYIGTLVQGKVEGKSYKDRTQIAIPKEKWIKVPHCHKAIIDKKTWEIVQTRLDTKVKMRPNKNGRVHIFSQKVYCACCGKIFQKNTCRVKSGTKAYLECRQKKRTGGVYCDNKKSIVYDELEEMILKEINLKLKEYYDMTKVEKYYYEKKVKNETDRDIDILKIEKEQCKKQILKQENAKEMLYDDRASGVLDLSEYVSLKNKYSSNITELKNRLLNIDEEIYKLENTQLESKNKEEILKKYKHIKKLDRIIVDEFIKVIYVDKFNPQSKKRRFQIVWNI